MSADLNKVIKATENISAAFRQIGEVATSYTQAMRPIVRATENISAAIGRLFPPIKEDDDGTR